MRTLLFLILLLIAGARFTSGQVPVIRDFSLNEQNLPVKVNALLQDSVGYIWLGTDKGLFRFNGNKFVRIRDSMEHQVTALALISGRLWVGFKSGHTGIVDRYFKNSLQYKAQQYPSAVWSIAGNATGDTIAMATEDGIFIVAPGDRTMVLDRASGLSDNFVYTLDRLPGNRFVAGTDNGINDVAWQGGKPVVSVATTNEGLRDNIVRVLRPVPGKNCYWVGMQQGGIALYDAAARKVLDFPGMPEWSYGQVNDILAIAGHRAWIATNEGYLLEAWLDKDSLVDLRAHHFPGKKFRKLLGDYSGNIWCATQNGISMFTPEYLNRIPLSGAYALQKMTAITCDRKGDIWLAQNEDLYRVTLTGQEGKLQPVLRMQAPVSCLYSDRAGRLWIGTMGKGLGYRNREGIYVPCLEMNVSQNGNILSITGTNDRLWVAALTGVEEWSYPRGPEGTLQLRRRHSKQSGIGSDYVYALFADRKERIWMATDGAGVCMLADGRYHHWRNADSFQAKVAYSITEDSRGGIWVGAYYKGLYHFNNRLWKERKHKEESDANIAAVGANATGQVLVVYERCIDEWYPGSQQFRHYNYRSGLDIDSTSEVLNCIARDPVGNVYIPYEHGLLVFTNQQKEYDIRPRVHINDISILLRPVTEYEKTFRHHENDISIRFEGISFTNPERLSYRYKLDGYVNKWIHTHDETVTFPNLPPGDYTFRIQTALDGDFVQAKEVTYTFSISAPFWKRPWFLTLLTLLLLFIVFRLVKFREQRQRERAQLLQERMHFEYEHLKSQVNPHFLFNSLNTLTNLIEENPEAAVSYTEQLSDLYKNILSYRNKDLIALREELELLSAYIFVQQSRFGKALQIQISIPEGVREERKIVPMALQMLVENAIKHNVVSLTQPLRLEIRTEHEEVIVTNPLQPKVSKEMGMGTGLNNIRRRYSLLTGRPVRYGAEGTHYVVSLPLL